MCKTCLVTVAQTHNCSFFALIINYPRCFFMWKRRVPFPLSSETVCVFLFAPGHIWRGTWFGLCSEKWLSLFPSSLGSPLVKGPASCSVLRWQVSQASPVTPAATLQGGSTSLSPPPPASLFGPVAKGQVQTPDFMCTNPSSATGVD